MGRPGSSTVHVTPAMRATGTATERGLNSGVGSNSGRSCISCSGMLSERLLSFGGGFELDFLQAD